MITVASNLDDFNRVLEIYRGVYSKGQTAALAKAAGNFARYLYAEAKKLAPASGKIKSSLMDNLAFHKGVFIHERTRNMIGRMYGFSGVNGYKKGQNSMTERKYETFSGSKAVRGNVRTVSMFMHDMIAKGLKSRSQKIQDKFRTLKTISTARRTDRHALETDMEIRLREGSRMFLAASAMYPAIIEKNTEAKSRIKDTILGQGQKLSSATVKATKDNDLIQFDWGVNAQQKSASALAGRGFNTQRGQKAVITALVNSRVNMQEYIVRKAEEASKKAQSQIRSALKP